MVSEARSARSASSKIYGVSLSLDAAWEVDSASCWVLAVEQVTAISRSSADKGRKLFITLGYAPRAWRSAGVGV